MFCVSVFLSVFTVFKSHGKSQPSVAMTIGVNRCPLKFTFLFEWFLPSGLGRGALLMARFWVRSHNRTSRVQPNQGPYTLPRAPEFSRESVKAHFIVTSTAHWSQLRMSKKRSVFHQIFRGYRNHNRIFPPDRGSIIFVKSTIKDVNHCQQTIVGVKENI